MKEFLFSICFISLSTNLKLSINIFIMSKLIKQAMISWPLVVSYFNTKKLVTLISCRARAGLWPERLGPGPYFRPVQGSSSHTRNFHPSLTNSKKLLINSNKYDLTALHHRV